MREVFHSGSHPANFMDEVQPLMFARQTDTSIRYVSKSIPKRISKFA
jgi:hypothetical protein